MSELRSRCQRKQRVLLRMRRKAGKNVTVKNRSIRAWLTAVTVTLCAVLSLPAVPAYADQFSHTYHTKVETTVQETGQPTEAVTAAGSGADELSDRTGAALFCGLHCCSLSASALLPYTELPGKEKRRHRPTSEKPNNTSIKRCRKAQT